MTVRRHTISSAVHAAKDDQNERVRYCSRCIDMFGVLVRLGPKILMPGVAKAADYHLWLECRGCGTLYLKNETKVEPELEPIKEPSDGRQVKITGTNKKRKTRGRGNNPRIKTRDDIKDPDLIRELKDGAILESYSSSEPL